jgi:hypothetical protein
LAASDARRPVHRLAARVSGYRLLRRTHFRQEEIAMSPINHVKHWMLAGLLTGSLACVAMLPVSAHASEKWTVKGRITAARTLPELTQAFGATSGVAGITVKVSARSKIPLGWGTWNSWGTMRTDADGNFQVTETHGNDRRQFRVEILFDSDRLRIKEGQETSIKLDGQGFPLDIDLDLTDKDWHEVHNDKGGDGRKAGVIDLGNIALTRPIVKQHADLWFLYNKVFDVLAGYGAGYAFQRKVVVKYPMGIANNNPNSASYSNPVNRHVYIKDGDFHARTLIHELMHQWVYDRSTGEDSMAWQLAKHGDTHQDRENTTFVPFHEGFAEWSSYKLIKEVTAGKLLNFSEDVVYQYPDIPLTRKYVGSMLKPSERSLANLDYTETGWHSLFNILTYPYLDRVDFDRPLIEGDEDKKTKDSEFAFVSLFSTQSCPDKRLGYSLKDVLSVFLKYPSKGIDGYMKKDDLNFRNFLDRAGAILPALEREKIEQVKSYLDPVGTSLPCPAKS